MRDEFAAFAELFALAGLAIAQPVFDILGRNPELFILWRTTTLQLVLLTAIVLLAVPLAAWALEFVVGLVAPRVRPIVHAGLLGLAAGAVVLQAVKGATAAGPGVLLGVAVLAAGAMVVARLRWSATATWLRILAVAPLIFGVLFAATSRVTDVVVHADAPTADVAVRKPSRVVMVTFDEFALTSILDGEGHIDREMYPNLAALADASTWYRNTTTVSPATTTAVPAALTGMLPGDQHDVPSTATHPRNLFTLLGGRYDLHVQEAATRLCPTSLCPPPPPRRGIHPGLRGMVVAAAQVWRRNASPDRTPASLAAIGAEDGFAVRTVDRFTAQVRASDRPTLDFLHVLIPHFPWHYLPTGQDYNAFQTHGTGLVDTGRGRFGGLAWSNDWTALAGRQRHIMNAQAADGALGRLVAHLREIGEYENTLIVVTADHGVAFRAGRTFRGVAPETWTNVAWIPLIIKAPGQTGGAIDDRPAQSIDILPTIADHLGIDLPYRVDGHSLLGAPRRDDTVRIMDWDANMIDPAPGKRFVEFDRSDGFRKVLAARAAPSASPAWVRPYLIGPYGGLIGRYAGPLVDATAPRTRGGIDFPERYVLGFDPFASRVPWADSQGTFAGRPGVDLALVANGRIVSVTRTQRATDGTTIWWGLVPPPLMNLGPNAMALYEIRGAPAAPRLVPVTLPTPGAR